MRLKLGLRNIGRVVGLVNIHGVYKKLVYDFEYCHSTGVVAWIEIVKIASENIHFKKMPNRFIKIFNAPTSIGIIQFEYIKPSISVQAVENLT